MTPEKETTGPEDIIIEAEKLIYEGSYAQAAELLEEKRTLFNGMTGTPIYARYRLKIAETLIFRRRTAEAMVVIDDLANLIGSADTRKPEWSALKQEMFWLEGRMRWNMGNRDLGRTLLEMAISGRKEEDGISAKIYGDLALFMRETGDLNSCISYFKKSLLILENNEPSLELARVHNNLSDAYLIVRRYDRALEHADRCVHVAIGLDNMRIAGFGYLNGSEAMIGLGDLDDAQRYLKGAGRILEENPESYLKSMYLHGLGMFETARGNHELASRTFEESVNLLENMDHTYALARIRFEYAVVLEKIGDREGAIEELKQAREAFKGIEHHPDLERTLEFLSRLEQG